MGVFSSKQSYYGTNSSAVAEVMATEAVECTFDNPYQESLRIIGESEYNHNQIMKAIGIYELASYEATGQVIYEAASLEGIWAKIKEFFAKIWAKIKGFFTKLIAMFDQYTKSGEEFAKKYKTKLLNIGHDLKDLEFKGYEFDNLNMDIDKSANAALGTIHSVVCAPGAIATEGAKTGFDKYQEDPEVLFDKIRGTVVGKSSVEVDEFHKELFTFFRKGENEKQEITGINLNGVVASLLASKKEVERVNKAFKATETAVKTIIKNLEDAKNKCVKTLPVGTDKIDAIEYRKGAKDGEKIGTGDTGAERIDAASRLSTYHTIHSRALSVVQQLNGALTTALKDKISQDKAYCVAAMSYKPKNESYEFGGQGSEGGIESFLSSVTLK